MKTEILKVNSKEELKICSALRYEVFGVEENASKTLYMIDELDKIKDTKNYLLKADGKFIGTARFVKIDDDVVKHHRMVVLKEFRRMEHTREILSFLEDDVKNLEYKKIIMDSALKAVGFYEKMNYKKVSDIFFEDNRPHVKMEKDIVVL